MDRQQEYEIRKQLSNFVENKINKQLDKYYLKYKDNKGFLLYYPLTFLENRFFTVPFRFYEKYKEISHESWIVNLILPSMYKEIIPDRIAITWFIKQMMKRGYNFKGRFYFDSEEYEEFLYQINSILSMYSDFKNSNEIKLMRTIAKVQIEEVGRNTFQISKPTISDVYAKENIYYYGLDDEEKRKQESLKILELDNYLLQKYNYFMDIMSCNYTTLRKKIKEIKDLKRNIDLEFYSLCIDRVSVDIDKIGCNFHSEIISNKTELKKIVGAFFYLCEVKLYFCNLLHFLNHEYLHELLIKVNINDLINNINYMTGISQKTIRNCINYFCLDCERDGIFNEFPLIKYNNTIVFIPTSFMMNDFQFSIVNGHYLKNIDIIKRDSTVSQSIVERIINKAQKYSNIVIANNRGYHVKEVLYEGKELQSEIDIALYDKLSNVLLVIECKWKENVYTLYEDYINIESAINKIFKNQLGKHKKFIEMADENINYLFDNSYDIIHREKISHVEYIFLDKRIQLHLQDKHTISEFILLHMFDEFSEKNILNLHSLIREIKMLKTDVDYEIPKECNEIIINDNKYLHNFFKLDY